MPGDTAGMAFDAGAECAGGTCVFDRIKYAISRNGTWLSPSGCGHDLAGTEFNMHPDGVHTRILANKRWRGAGQRAPRRRRGN